MISLSRTGRTLQRMNRARQTPTVPLEAGAAPTTRLAPPAGSRCSAGSGEARPGSARSAAARAAAWASSASPASAEEALRELDRLGAGGSLRIANRRASSAALGGAGWAGLEPGARYLFTVEAVRRLVAVRDQVVVRRRWAPGAGIAAMWQTVLNSVTFGRNVALGALGRAEAVPAEQRWQRRIDALICVVAGDPGDGRSRCPLELCAAALGRGGAVSLRLELL